MRTKSKWSPGPGVRILGVALTVDDGWVVSAAGSTIGICPDCGRRSRSRHGWSIGRNIDRPVEDWQFSAPEDLKFVDLQKSVGTKASKPSSQFERRLLKLASEVGLLVVDFMAGRLEDNQASIVGRLVAILRNLRDAAEEAGLSLADAAAENLRKSHERWPQQKRYPSLLDASFPEHEQLPRKFSLTLVENGEPGKRQVTPY